jgi:hypothetical protein
MSLQHSARQHQHRPRYLCLHRAPIRTISICISIITLICTTQRSMHPLLVLEAQRFLGTVIMEPKFICAVKQSRWNSCTRLIRFLISRISPGFLMSHQHMQKSGLGHHGPLPGLMAQPGPMGHPLGLGLPPSAMPGSSLEALR